MVEGRFSFAGFYERRRGAFPRAVRGDDCHGGRRLFRAVAQRLVGTLRGALGTLFFASKWSFGANGRRLRCRDRCRAQPTAAHMVLGGGGAVLCVFPDFAASVLPLFPPIYRLGPDRWCRGVVGRRVPARPEQKRGGVLSSPFRAWELLAGSLLAFNAVPLMRSRALRELTAGAGLSNRRSMLRLRRKDHLPRVAALIPVLGAVAIIHAGASGSSLAGRLLQLQPVVYIGLISYSLYLWHWPLIVLIRYAMGMEPLTP